MNSRGVPLLLTIGTWIKNSKIFGVARVLKLVASKLPGIIFSFTAKSLRLDIMFYLLSTVCGWIVSHNLSAIIYTATYQVVMSVVFRHLFLSCFNVN